MVATDVAVTLLNALSHNSSMIVIVTDLLLLWKCYYFDTNKSAP